jgi:AraC-like DNA-binding protein
MLQDRAVLIVDPHGRIGRVDLPAPYRVTPVNDWVEIWPRLPETGPEVVFLADPYQNDGKTDHRFWDLLERFPSLTVVAAMDVHARRVVDLRRMAMAGISETWNLRIPYSQPLAASLLNSTCARPLKRALEPHLSRFVSGNARIILRAAAEVAVRRGGAQELAHEFGVSRVTIGMWCESEALPPPRRLQLWLRVLLATQLLQDTGRTIREAAAPSGYSTDRSLRRVMNQLLGSDTRSLRSNQPFEVAARVFNEELRSLRERRTHVRQRPARAVVPVQGAEIQSAPAG